MNEEIRIGRYLFIEVFIVLKIIFTEIVLNLTDQVGIRHCW